MNEIIENELKGLRAIGLMHERQVKEAMERIADAYFVKGQVLGRQPFSSLTHVVSSSVEGG
jgi:hypothetical protein